LPGALAPACGRNGRGHHVLDSEPGARAAVVARRPTAILEPVLGKGLLEVLPEEVAVQSGRNVIPGQDFVLVAMAVHDLADIETGGLERVRPQLQIEMLGPFLKGAPGPPDVFDDRAHTAVAPTGETLDGRRLRVVPAKGQAP